jgi:hypothetical protein
LFLSAKPWQRALVGAAPLGVGLATGAIVITVLGGVVAVTTVYFAGRSLLSKRTLGSSHDEDSH